MFKTGEIYEIMKMFEKMRPVRGEYERSSREDIEKFGAYYNHGEVNTAFRMFLNGYSFGKSVGLQSQ